MITIEKDRLIITINEFGASEVYSDMIHELLDLLYCKDPDFTQQHKNIILLLEHMMPTHTQAEAMIEKTFITYPI